MATLDPRGMVGRIYEGDCKTLLHTKYKRFQIRSFLCFSYYKSMGANDPQGVANLDPRSMIGKIYVGYH